jgi:thymidylate synthase (FAD)
MKESLPVRRPVLNAGFVVLEEVMGDDEVIVRSARVSTGSSGNPEKDRKLLQYLMQHDHATPFESVVFRFHIKCPFFVARQWFRHRIASYNEYSLRYRQAIDDYYVPEGVLSEEEMAEYRRVMEESLKYYRLVIERSRDLATIPQRRRVREVVRGVLGSAFYTEFFWTINFRSLMNFLRLRLDPGAQWEIRQYAESIREMVRAFVPWGMEAFELQVKGSLASDPEAT